ncbi:tRNA (N6-threonylcarbamoyladenosine(37)-N6)-methyltransferase TrmO [Idiomarina seosinensis]|uniref:tRNA (N6-threonylcarbamoyladenosine(37)-N6)-methyltransferase TrmO n=1 Tax=Idiomarina seosinensis TaxID=281739 RepID=A0A432ZH40_9GAMM|nr:tRNA (N6-threonylcarbamoyladenosine(37)-N6)-methyltransferase TrmO [Idiomarina seosinensis]RUO77281.1 tRNA (N6-threonylcarbamoyladenosine(37)-N6)-methyltransferase TrmO [Idiomarina seosinensis]
MHPIAIVHSPFPEKFSIPRQPGLAPAVTSTIVLTGDYDHQASIEGIEQHSHLWLVFEFHQHSSNQWKEKVRPPRLGGNKSVGVFATRSPFRPNNLGLSVVKLVAVKRSPTVELVVAGADLLDQTPIIDIKPYVPYVDCINSASSEFAGSQPEFLTVAYSERAAKQLDRYLPQTPELKQVIDQVLRQDPRPAYHKHSNHSRQYGSRLFNYDIRWVVNDKSLMVEEIKLFQP